ncbi:alpha/beta-hydrolase [Imleria badia]|nr:alpha/beta-hydrolase [Imleria badia]
MCAALCLLDVVPAFPFTTGPSDQVVFQGASQDVFNDGTTYLRVSHPCSLITGSACRSPRSAIRPSRFSNILVISTSPMANTYSSGSSNPSSPSDDPLILWLTSGGPDCSSSLGLLFELRPCLITRDGNDTVHNPNSWNARANLMFLDQPVGVGYSYATDGSSVSTSPTTAIGY